MEIGLREWLIVIGFVVIGGILFDGWRRMSGKGKLKLDLERDLANLPDFEDPNVLGPARVNERDNEPAIDEQDLPSLSSAQAARKKRNEPKQGDLQLDEDHEPEINAALEDEDSEPAQEHSSAREPVAFDEVLVIHVIAREEGGFKGESLLQKVLESGMRFGEMDIFHRHESIAGNGDVQFSMANGVNPGTFDLNDMSQFSTPAVSFFLGLPGPRHPRQAFDLMVSASRKLGSELGGDLKDENRSVLTSQTIEHYRQRIAEFERRRLTQKNKI